MSYTPPIAFHPGSTLFEKMAELNITPNALAVKIGVEVDVIHKIMNEKADITLYLAKRFEYELGIPAHFWLAKQEAYNAFVLNFVIKTKKS